MLLPALLGNQKITKDRPTNVNRPTGQQTDKPGHRIVTLQIKCAHSINNFVELLEQTPKPRFFFEDNPQIFRGFPADFPRKIRRR